MLKYLSTNAGVHFTMGKGDSRRLVHPDMGARHLTLNHSVFQPGQEFPQHIHDNSEDVFVVLQGGVSVREGDVYTSISTGQAAFIPQGEVHGTVNTTDDIAVLISFQGPPDMMLYNGARERQSTDVHKLSGKHHSKVRILHVWPGANGQAVKKVISPELTQSRHLGLTSLQLKATQILTLTIGNEAEAVLFVIEGRLHASDLVVAGWEALFIGGRERIDLVADEPVGAVLCVSPPVSEVLIRECKGGIAYRI